LAKKIGHDFGWPKALNEGPEDELCAGKTDSKIL